MQYLVTWIFVHRACTEIDLIGENSDIWFLLRDNWLSSVAEFNLNSKGSCYAGLHL